MEFFATVACRPDAARLHARLTVADLPRWCASIERVLADHGADGEIYTVWGQFRVHREEIRDGVRFTLPGCPNALAWTVRRDESAGLLVHCTIDRRDPDPDFATSLQRFVADWAHGLERGLAQDPGEGARAP